MGRDCEQCGKCANLKEKDTSLCENSYTILVFSENNPGLLSQISAIFTRRQVNIDSINSCSSSVPNVHKFTITCVCTESMVKMLTAQMEKRVDVLQANYYVDDEIYMLEAAMMKLSTPVVIEHPEISEIIRAHGGHIIAMNATYSIMEKIGRSATITDLNNQLQEYHAVLQFVRSGRICITKSTTEHLDNFLAMREEQRLNNEK